MKQCLNCKNFFEEKKETAKYCSVSCRVAWNRKNKDKPKSLTEKQKIDVLYNLFLELIEKHKKETFLPKQAEQVFMGTPTHMLEKESELKLPITTYNTSSIFEQRLRGCKSIEGIKKVVDEIDSSDLSFPPKKRLKDLAIELSKDFFND